MSACLPRGDATPRGGAKALDLAAHPQDDISTIEGWLSRTASMRLRIMLAVMERWLVVTDSMRLGKFAGTYFAGTEFTRDPTANTVGA